MFPSLNNLPLLQDFETRSISAENPDGAKGGGAKADSTGQDAARLLGRGWKVRPCITLPAGSTTTLADIQGPGCITHIWITVEPRALAECVLRFRWDGEDTPSIETPLGDFFCCGHGLRAKINSLPVAVNPSGGMNCYWPMPFRKSCEITIENQRGVDQGCFFYQVDYALRDVPAEAAYFHAQFRQSTTTRECPEHVILDGVKGDGQYVGTYVAWNQFSDGWWGEGEVKFYLDGDGEFPTYCGTGTEDYFGGAWGFGETFSTAFMGYPLWFKEEGRVPKHGLYRWHICDAIRFRQDFKATIQALGWWPEGVYEALTDDLASVGYWYQREPHAPFPTLPDKYHRLRGAR
ncbi:MAG: DUF2961 domain-containing protein [candidate division WS1 bacterium]|nr:DUF2961 domain-containing protein [candidate division WS1 bacterium]